MSGLNVVRKAHAGIERALAAGDWAAADRGIQYFAGAWLRALPAADGDELADLANQMKLLRMRVMTEQDVDQNIGPVEIAWMLAAVTAFVAQATKPVELTARNTQGLILEALAQARHPISTTDIATRIGRAVATVARLLPDMRQDGYVIGTPAGSSMLNQITEFGRQKCLELFEAAAVPEPTSLAKEHDRPEPANQIEDLAGERDASLQNDLESVLSID